MMMAMVTRAIHLEPIWAGVFDMMGPGLAKPANPGGTQQGLNEAHRRLRGYPSGLF